jgi:3-methyladenine DNA glycosylase/8-oxoguanine DNA glycosylase
MNAVRDYPAAVRRLRRRDPVLAAIIRARGPCRLADDPPQAPFVALVDAIVSQQLSPKASATILRRVLALFPPDGGATPAGVAAAPDPLLRGAGLSPQKLGYVRDLCDKILSGALPPLDALDDLDDEQIVETLTRVKGIGRWSAEMFLIFRMRRPDVLPVGDLGIVKAIQRAYRLRTPPSPNRMRRIAEPWRPYRSIACWYLWASLDNTPETR